MNTKQKRHVKQKAKTKKEDNLKLTSEDISQLGSFADLSQSEKEELVELVYNLSLILYKSFIDEKA